MRFFNATFWGLIGISCLSGAAGAWFMARFAGSLGLMDRPNRRSSHRIPTPRGGGVGIFFAFLVCSLVSELTSAFWAPLAILALLGLAADRIELSAASRLSAQLVLAAVLVIGTGPGFLAAFGVVPAAIFGVVFITGTANFYNFMDGINGIAAVTGMVAFTLLGCHFQSAAGTADLVPLCLGLAAACLGFVPFNLPRARVFMGDVGSILLGGAFAALVWRGSVTPLDFIVGASFLLPFYADELTTMSVRIRDRQNLTRPHRRHLYQILANEGGIAHWQVTLGYGLGQALMGASTLVARRFGTAAVIIVLMAYAGLFAAASSRCRTALEHRPVHG